MSTMRVRFEAAAAIQALMPALVAHGSEVLHKGFRRQAGAHPMWGMMEPAWFRRQTLRWLLADHPRPTPGVESILRAALQDPDWEVRAGALIGTVRYRSKGLGGLVETCPLPRVSRNGPSSADRAILRALQRVGCALLAGRRPPQLGAAASPKARALDRLAKLLGHAELEPGDDADLLVYALTTPIDPGEEPAVLHPGISVDEEGPYLDSLRLVQVPDGFSWSNRETGEGVQQIYGGGFLIAREPVGGVDDPQPMNLASAADWCRRHSTKALGLRLPTLAEWTLAARGNDDWRIPWGNGHQQDSPTAPGPRGTFGHGSLGEWATDATGSPVHCGPGVRPMSRRRGTGAPAPAGRSIAQINERERYQKDESPRSPEHRRPETSPSSIKMLKFGTSCWAPGAGCWSRRAPMTGSGASVCRRNRPRRRIRFSGRGSTSSVSR